MNTQSKRTLRWLVATAAVAVVVAGASVAGAQSRGDRGPWNRLDLTKDQRAKVEKIVKEHREASREELHKELAGVLTEEQMAELDRMDGRRGGDMWDNRPGRQNRQDFRGRRGGKMQGMGDCRRQCDGPCGMRGGKHGMRGGRGGMHGGMRGDMRGMRGRGPGSRSGMGHTGEFREERGERMVERLSVVLDLTDTQEEQIEKIVQDHHAQFKDFDPSKLTFEERQKTREAHRALLANRIKEVLTPAQQEKYDEWMKTMPGPRRGRRGR